MTQAAAARVALVAHAIHDHGGMERAFAELLRETDGRFRVTVVAGELDLPADLRAKVDWKRVPIPARPNPLRFALFFLLGGLRLLWARADLVHTMGAIVPNRADIASVHFCHAGFRSSNDESPKRLSLAKRLNGAAARALALAAERWCYRTTRVRALAAVSGGVEREVHQHYPGVPVFLTPNGVDTRRFSPDAHVQEELRRDEGIGSDEVVALFVGGDWVRKGLELAIEALATAGENMTLWVVGEGDSKQLSGLARSRGVGERVRFFGPRPDAERFYQAADVFVLPSSYETFSIAAYEAAACGLPVVGTRVSGVEELIGADEAGVLVERDAVAIGTALRRLAADRALRVSMGAAGRARTLQFTWERSTESVLAAYRDLLEQRSEHVVRT